VIGSVPLSYGVSQLSGGFEWSPTEGQLRAFEDVRRDMVWSRQPMDRLVVGDVGVGKTEVSHGGGEGDDDAEEEEEGGGGGGGDDDDDDDDGHDDDDAARGGDEEEEDMLAVALTRVVLLVQVAVRAIYRAVANGRQVRHTPGTARDDDDDHDHGRR
jgi:hypothetical protein